MDQSEIIVIIKNRYQKTPRRNANYWITVTISCLPRQHADCAICVWVNSQSVNRWKLQLLQQPDVDNCNSPTAELHQRRYAFTCHSAQPSNHSYNTYRKFAHRREQQGCMICISTQHLWWATTPLGWVWNCNVQQLAIARLLAEQFGSGTANS